MTNDELKSGKDDSDCPAHDEGQGGVEAVGRLGQQVGSKGVGAYTLGRADKNAVTLQTFKRRLEVSNLHNTLAGFTMPDTTSPLPNRKPLTSSSASSKS